MPHVVLALLTFVLAQVLIGASGMTFLEMIARLNRTRTPSDQISYFFGRPGAFLPIVREYTRTFPDGRLHRWLFGLGAAGLALAAASFWLIGIIRLP